MFFHHYHQVLWVVKWGTLRTDCQSDTINYMYFFKTEISLNPVFFFPEEILHENSQQDNEVQRDL